jgi:hypothetical protein
VFPVRKSGMQEYFIRGVVRIGWAGWAARAVVKLCVFFVSYSRRVRSYLIVEKMKSGDEGIDGWVDGGGRGNVQVISKRAQQEDGYSEGVASCSGVPVEELRDDFVVVFCSCC